MFETREARAMFAQGDFMLATFGVHATLLAAEALAVFPLLLPIPIFYFECREREFLLGKSSDSESPTPVDTRGSPFLSNDAFGATNRNMNIMTGSTCDDPTAGKGIGELGIVSGIFV